MTQSAPTGTRKYGGAHKALRRRLLAALEREPGQPCARCGGPMYPWQLLDLDHYEDGSTWRGLAHRSCNRRAGQQQTTVINRARNAWRRHGTPAAPWPSARRW
jgi:hypothetical protein